MAVDAIIVGAGPAGLATSRELLRAGVSHVVLERGDEIGHTWTHMYRSLVLHTGKHLSALPGMSFPSSTPLFPTRADMVAYLHRYAERFELPIETRSEVASLTREHEGWVARTTAAGEWRARAVILATGIVSNPYVPDFANRHDFGGRAFHSAGYRGPEGFRGRRVLVIGAGNSGGEISAELAGAGAEVTVAVRGGVRVVPRSLVGIPTQYFAAALASLPAPAQRGIERAVSGVSSRRRGADRLPRRRDTGCPHAPLIGFHLADALRSGRMRLCGGVAAFTPDGVQFTDGRAQPFDDVIFATGYRAAVGVLGNSIRVDDCGFARRRDRIVSADQPDLYFVGHNYDIRGGLLNIARDARTAAARIRATLGETSRTSTETPRPPSER